MPLSTPLTDGNILVSMRHQSWVLKIDYNNGAGTGNVCGTSAIKVTSL